MSEKESTLYPNPCKVCGEKLCLGSECPVAEAEREEEIVIKRSTYYKRRKSIPPQIRSVLKKARIFPPRNGKSEIQLYKKEEDPSLTLIKLVVDGTTRSVTQTQDRINTNTTLKFKDGILIKTLYPEKGPNLVVV